MTTKEQERQAMEKIRKIVEGLGENSYIGTAMEGVLELAEQNIEYDAAFSMKAQAELAEKEAAQLKETVEQQAKELKELRAQLQMEREKASKAMKEAEQRKMYDWMYESITDMAVEEGKRLEREKNELAAQMAAAIMDKDMEQADKEKLAERYRRNGAERQDMERFQQAFKKKYEGDFLNG